MNQLIKKCEELAFDLDFTRAKQWKSEGEGRVLVGHMPIYFPREIVHAMNGLAVGILGGGDKKQIIRGDAYYQSYICHMPRGIIELALDGHFDGFEGFLFPSICDVIRNLSGMFRILKKGKFVKYMDFPQNFQKHIGGEFYKSELMEIADKISQINQVEFSVERFNESIQLFNKNRQLTNTAYNLRKEAPWKISAAEMYSVIRAGYVIPVEEHNEILEKLIELVNAAEGVPQDKIRVQVIGAFCEQPPLSLIRTIELAGCYIVEDDFLLGSKWIQGDIEADTSDPVGAIVDAYINHSTFSSTVYDVDDPKEYRMLELFKESKGDGIIFAAPSFCDPALLDHPILQSACDKNGIRYISFLFSENTGQFKVIKEQAGTFSDSIKLWDGDMVGLK
ncbi:MAG: benzoyl-CoA reductase subunit C [Bacteroidales bacterium]|nr:benzoyl-CoA reductase subunit C [Bacteroidales bacterium]